MATALQAKVWQKLKSIPLGEVWTYSKLARAVGAPKAVRAVATAVGLNPDPIVVPCHRIVRADGSIGKYSGPGGSVGKAKLLKAEGVLFVGGKIDEKARLKA